MEKEKLKALFAKYLEDKLPPEEIRTLFCQLESEQDLGDIRQLVRHKISKLEKQNFGDDPSLQPVYDRVYQRILAGTEDKIVTLPARKRSWRLIAAVAAILISMSGYFLFFNSDHQADSQQSRLSQAAYDILPGSNRAVLTLSDGSQVLLNEAGIGELAEQNGIQISKSRDGTLVYDASSLAGKGASAVSYNTVSTPRGGQYRVILPDGTKVWLNAASSLRYPTVFAENERQVELTGEAYFEAAHSKTRPFVVKTLHQEVQVLGTHFNVTAYKDDIDTRTTLLEGTVKIITGDHAQLLKPGQQSRVMPGSSKVRVIPDINTDAAVAWKNGKFIFEGEKIESIMKKISRWYNAEIIYQGEITDNEFIGTISRFENVSEVLNLLQLTGTVRFKIEASSTSEPAERGIIVMP